MSNAGWSLRDAVSKFTPKVIPRYYTPVKLNKMGLVKDDQGWKCKKSTMGSNLFFMRDCSLVFPFWKQIKTITCLATQLSESPPANYETGPF